MKAAFDVIVIGGGVLGAATAYELASRGHSVAVLERTFPGRQGSGTTAGNLHIQAIHTRRPGQQSPVDVTRFLPLQRTAHELWTRVEDRLGEPVGLVESGGFTVAETDEDLAALHEKAVWEREVGIPTEVLDRSALREAAPELGETVIGATWCAQDGYANALLTIPAYLRGAQRHGARVFTQAPVEAVERVGGDWLVTSRVGEFTAPAVINVAGPWIQQVSRMAGFDLEMAPLAIQMLETVRAPRFLDYLVQHISRGLSVKQVAGGNLVIGGGWPSAELVLGGYTPVLEESVVGNLADAVRIVPGVERYRLSRAWAGPLAATPDEMPVLGEVGEGSGYYVGGGTYAFTFSPLWARTLAELVEGAPPSIEIADLGPERLMRESAATSER